MLLGDAWRTGVQRKVLRWMAYKTKLGCIIIEWLQFFFVLCALASTECSVPMIRTGGIFTILISVAHQVSTTYLFGNIRSGSTDIGSTDETILNMPCIYSFLAV